jgi:3'(2'), 5'-bisphosphate nucleotidase
MYERESAAALEAAGLAGRVILDHYARFEVIPDAPASISTDADREAQECILQYLRRHFPEDAFCAEETTAALRDAAMTGPRLWIVDPIDGTRGFARKNGEFSAMIGFVEEGRIAVGVVAEPARARLTYAVRGGGCWRRDETDSGPVACRVSAVRTLAEATITQSRSRTPGKPSRYVQALTPARVVETYSAGIKLALVARGEADVYLNTYDQFHDWDICAGHILVAEAGGEVTDLDGNALIYGQPGAWQRHGLLASNGQLHQAALAAMKRGPG